MCFQAGYGFNTHVQISSGTFCWGYSIPLFYHRLFQKMISITWYGYYLLDSYWLARIHGLLVYYHLQTISGYIPSIIFIYIPFSSNMIPATTGWGYYKTLVRSTSLNTFKNRLANIFLLHWVTSIYPLLAY